VAATKFEGLHIIWKEGRTLIHDGYCKVRSEWFKITIKELKPFYQEGKEGTNGRE
jgi:hypothetical protein